MPVKSIVITENPVTNWEMFEETLDQDRFASPRIIHRDQGGFYQASFEYIPRSREDAIAFLNTSLGRNVVFYNEHGGIDFEGFINTIKMDTGTAQIKNSLNDMANRVWTRYTPVGGGAVTRSNIMESAISQARYGIKEVPLSGGEIDAALADQLAQAYLNLHYWPIPQLDQISLGGKLLDKPRIEVDVYGYFRTLEWRVWNQTADAGTQAASAEVQDIIGLASDLKTSLISWWKLDEYSDGTGAVARVDSHGSNDLTDNNTTPSGAGKIIRATQHTNAIPDYLSHVSNADLQTGDIDFTFAAWVWLDNKLTNQFFIAKDGAVAGQREYILYYAVGPTDRFAFGVFTAVDVAHVVTDAVLGAPAISTWYFIVAWHDSTLNTVNIQINDGAVTSLATGGALQAASNATFMIGNNGLGPGFALDGRVDEVGFWKRILTADEKTALYNAGAGLSYGDLGRRIGGVGQFVNTDDIEANGSLVTKEYDADRKAADILQSIADLGNSDYRIFIVGMEEDRQFYYREAAPPVRS